MSKRGLRYLHPSLVPSPQPHSEEAEKALIGAILLFPELSVHIESLSLEDFYLEKSKMIAEVIFERHKERQPIDMIAVASQLRLRKLEGFKEEGPKDQLEAIGGLTYLGECIDTIPQAAHVEHYAKVVREMSIRRQLAELLAQARQSALGPEKLNETFGRLQAELRRLEGGDQQKPASATDVLRGVFSNLQQSYESGVEPARLKTGIQGLDRMLWISPDDLIVLAGRPSMGKTSLALSMADHMAQEKKVLFFSLEMSKEALGMRLLSHRSGVPINRIRDPRALNPEKDLPRLLKCMNSPATNNLMIDDRKGLKLSDIRSVCRATPNLGAVFIDYVGKIEPDDPKQLREQQVTEISKGLEAMAHELQAPVILLAQLNRSLEKRPDKRPIPSDLRESGSLEQDADALLFVYRDEVYNQDSEDKGIAEILIGKQRNGETGVCRAVWRAETTSYLDLDDAPLFKLDDYRR